MIKNLLGRFRWILLIALGVLVAAGIIITFTINRSMLPGFQQQLSNVSSGVDSENVRNNIEQDDIDRTVSDEVIRAFIAAEIPVLGEAADILNFTLPMLDDEDFTLSDLRGNVVFLHFWTTWCVVCRVNMPFVEALYQRFKNSGLEIIAVNLGEPRAVAALYISENELNFPVALDTRNEIGSIYTRSIPTVYIINRRGLIVARQTGFFNWDTPEVTAAFEILLAE